MAEKELKNRSRCCSFFLCSQDSPQAILMASVIINFYYDVLKQSREGICLKCPENWKNNKWFIHYDNAPVHTLLIVQWSLTSTNISVPPIHPIDQLTFSISQDKIMAEKALFQLRRSRQERRKCSTRIWELWAWNYKKNAEIVPCSRELLWMRWCKLGVVVINYYFLEPNSRNFWITHHM